MTKAMTACNKLKLFYEIKNNRIEKYTGISLYSKYDIDEVSNPDNTYLTQESYWKYLMTQSANLQQYGMYLNFSGLNNTTCIWCNAFVTNSFLIDNDCIRCTYGKRNGICKKGLWLRMMKILHNRYPDLSLRELFPTEWYVNLINNIERTSWKS